MCEGDIPLPGEDLTSGLKTGRESIDQITICDLIVVNVQEMHIARIAFEAAANNSPGLVV